VIRLRPFAVAFASGGAPWHVAIVSAIQATAMVLGVGESVKEWRAAPFYVIGYAVGAFVELELRACYPRVPDERH
jgi:hypothetical protein